jgi:hypothetical protein
MKTPATILALLAILVFAGTAAAVDPTPGLYSSSSSSGVPFPEGRGSQSNENPGNANQGLGDVYNAQSWDLGVLGDKWRFECGVQNAVQGIVCAGNFFTFTNTFVGGTFFLHKNGPWGDGVNDLTGTINTTTSIINVPVQSCPNYVPIGPAVGNVTTTGQFDNSSCTLRFVIGNLVGEGDTDLVGPLPANYPPLLDTACNDTRVNGSWGQTVDISLLIECPTPSEPGTWGTLKSLYR